MQKTFNKDATTGDFMRSLVAMYYKSVLFGIVFPFVLHQFGPLLGMRYELGRTYVVFLLFMLATIPFLIWVTRVRIGWGESLTFSEELIVQKKDGSTIQIVPATIERVRIKPGQIITIMWRDDGKRRVCIIGREGFANSTWRELEPFARDWLPRR